jgi:hypothetical protein
MPATTENYAPGNPVSKIRAARLLTQDGSHKPELVGECHRLRPAVDTELAEDPLDVRRDGVGADDELARDLIRAEAPREHAQDLQAAADSTPTLTAAQIAQFTALDAALTPVLDAPSATVDPPPFKGVNPHEFDPGKTILVQAAWSGATGCPTDAKVAISNATGTGIDHFEPYTDDACQTGDPKDNENDGLVLVKTGPTNNFAAAVAELKGVKNLTPLTELGYDIRKSGGSGGSSLGSHCGAGAPRFDVVTSDNVVHFIGCNSPPGLVAFPASAGWVRLRWDPATGFPPVMPTDTVKRIVIVFDEGQDASGAPDMFGAAVLDNIDVNGTLVGHGPDDSEP